MLKEKREKAKNGGESKSKSSGSSATQNASGADTSSGSATEAKSDLGESFVHWRCWAIAAVVFSSSSRPTGYCNQPTLRRAGWRLSAKFGFVLVLKLCPSPAPRSEFNAGWLIDGSWRFVLSQIHHPELCLLLAYSLQNNRLILFSPSLPICIN